MAVIKRLCVYCGSSPGVEPSYSTAAARLGTLLAESHVELVYGGGRVGLMGTLADAALAAGGRITGIIPRHLHDREVGHPGVSELIVVGSMHERKQRMFEIADAFAVLPGGLGTLDETFEMITWRQLGLHDKPLIIIDIAGYWTPLLELFEHSSRTASPRGLTRLLSRGRARRGRAAGAGGIAATHACRCRANSPDARLRPLCCVLWSSPPCAARRNPS